jgi:RHS repeat-associated protein
MPCVAYHRLLQKCRVISWRGVNMLRWMLCLVLSSLCFQPVNAVRSSLSEIYLGSREGDPAGLVENVSTIHGDYTEVEVDLTVPAPDTLLLARFYSSRDTKHTAPWGGWRFNPHCVLNMQKDPKGKSYSSAAGRFERTLVYVGNPDGSVLTYVGWKSTLDVTKNILFTLDAEAEVVGLTNTAHGDINCWTNLKNNELYFNPQNDSFELFLCSGGKRFYQKHASLGSYFITHEVLPSGNKIFYEFDDQGQLTLIKETNTSEKKVLAWIKIDYGNEIHVETSDKKTVDYRFERGSSETLLLTTVTRSDKPDLRYQYRVVDDRALLLRKSLPDGRCVQVDYYTDKANRHRVQSITTPVGPDETLTTRFTYGEDCTEINGPGSRKTVHRFDDNSRLIAIEQYLDGSPYRVHKKEWGVKNDAGNLISTSIEDSSGSVFYHKSFQYDDRGNIIEEREYGNLKGADSTPFSIDEEGRSNQEAHVKTYSYFNGKNTHGFSQKDNKGTRLKCWYKKGTNLLLKKFILATTPSDEEEEGEEEEIKKRYFYDYNEDAALVKVIVDDGNCREAKQTYNVHERHITLISPKQELPNVGAPELIEEKYLNVGGGKEALLQRTVNQFDAQGLVIAQAISDANETHRYTLVKGYDHGLLSFETDPMGNEIHYSYDANQNLTHISRSDTGVSITYGYDLRNRLIYTLEKDRMGNQFKTCISYDLAGYKISERDRFGNETVYVNDSLGRPVQITHPESSDGPRSSIQPAYTYTYDLFDNPLSVTDTKGKRVTTSFNSRGKPAAIHYLDGSQELFKYDHEGSLHRYLGRDGFVQVFEYDYIGRLNHIEYYKRGSKGSEEGFKRKYYNYNAFQMTSKQDERGGKTTYSYDGAGRLATLSKEKQKVEFIYDALGRTQGVKKWKSSNTFTLEVKEYDLLNRVIEQQIQDSQGHTLAKKKYIYNDAGQVAQIIAYPQNQERVLTQYEYDGLGRPCKITGPSNQIIVIRYDDIYINEWGQKTRKRILIDPLGNQTEEIFDNSGHLIKVTKKDKTGHLLAEIEFSYDIAGNKVLEKAARISSEGLLSTYETEWSFNDRLQSVTLGKGTSQERVTAFEYNSYGDLATKYNPSSKEPITYQYNAYGHLKTISYHEENKEISHQLSYDMNRNLKEMRLSSAQVVTYSYDTHDQPLSETIKDEFGSYQVSRIYDGEGNIQILQFPDGSSVHYSYEGPFVKSVVRFTKDGKALYNYQVASRDQMGNTLEEILPGDAGGRKQAWDSSGRRIEISTDFFQDTVLEGGYDLLDNIKKRETVLDDEKSTAEYEYNALSQLILETGGIEHRYSYDSLGNRLQKDGSVYTVNDLNQLVEAEGASYTFDANGSLATKTMGQKTWAYQWNPLNQLISIKDPDQNSVSFTYDLSGKRLTKKIEPQGKKAKIFRFFYLGNTEIGALDEKGSIVELKVPSDPNNPEIAPCVAIEIKKASYVPLYDLQGNITCLLNPQKRKIVESYRHSSFGEEEIINERGRIVSDSAVGNPWRYRGKRVDKEVGLVCFGQRYYDPEIGRWISPDPAGDIEGPNLYAFAQNNPMTYVDYFGLASELNENQSKAFNGYFYGEYEPRCHCEAHRTCKRGGDIASSMGADFILNSPRFHGCLQALGGLVEASCGGGMTLATYGVAVPIGWPVMAHGLDHLITGISTAFTGRPRDTLTSHLLQTIGTSQYTASFVDSGLSIGGTIGAATVIHASRIAAFPKFSLPENYALGINQANEQILFGQKSVSACFSEKGTFELKPISEVVQGLKNGTISPESLPIEIIVRNGQKITLNNRSLLALRRAGIAPKLIINRTGIKDYELLLDEHLRGNLPSDIIKIRGGPAGTSLIGPVE